MVVLCLWFDSNVNYRLRENHSLEHDRVAAIAKSVTSCYIFETKTSNDVTRHCELDVFSLVRMHQQQTTNIWLERCGDEEDQGKSEEDEDAPTVSPVLRQAITDYEVALDLP